MIFDHILEYVSGFLPVFCRVAGLFCLFPIGEAADHFFKRIILILVFTPSFYQYSAGTWDWVALGTNFIIGLTIALPFLLLISVAEMVGDLFDAIRGMTMVVFIDPSSQSPLALNALAARWITLALLISSGALVMQIDLLRMSFIWFPASGEVLISYRAFGMQLVALISSLFTNALWMCVGFSTIFLLIEFSAALISKLLKLSLWSETFTIKTIVSYLVIISVLSWLPSQWIFEDLMGSQRALSLQALQHG